MKVKYGGKIMTKFFGSRAKTYSQLTDDGSKDKKRKGHKKVCHKKIVNLEIAKKIVQKQLSLRIK